MIKKRLLTLVMCAVLACLLTACGNSGDKTVSDVASKAGDAVSRIKDDVSETVSRVESFLEGDTSRSSAPDYSGNVDSGNDGFLDDNSSGLAGSVSSHLTDSSRD